MAVFIENCEDVVNLLPNHKEMRMRFQIKSPLCNTQSNEENYTCEETKFHMSNLRWGLIVETNYGKIMIELDCESKLRKTCTIKLHTDLTIIDSETNNIQHLENLSEQIFNKQNFGQWLVYDYVIDSNYLQSETVTMELIIKVESNIQIEMDKKTLRRWLELQFKDFEYLPQQFKILETTNRDLEEEMGELFADVYRMEININDQQTTIENLKKKLHYYEEDEEMLKMFKDAVGLFKRQCCKRFEHDMELDDYDKIRLDMVSINSNDSEKFIQRRDKLQQLEDKIENLKNLELKQEDNVNYKATNLDLHVELLQEKFNAMSALVDEVSTKNNKLQAKDLHLESDQKNLYVVKEALRMFEMKCCSEFKYDVDLGDNIKLHCDMILNQNDDAKSNDSQRVKELEAEVTELRQQLAAAKSNRQTNS